MEDEYGTGDKPLDLQTKLELESQTSATPTNATSSSLAFAVPPASHEDILMRSVFIKNVDYQVTQLMLEEHFRECGPIVRSTIRTNA